MKLVFATGNNNKVREINEILDQSIQIIGLKEIGCHEEIPETQPTIIGNALQKAQYVFTNYGVHCFSEDTGLEVDALGGAPGVNTARYAGESKDADANMSLLLKNMDGITDRTARFRTVIALIQDGKEHTFEGICEGNISPAKVGTGGFGYDPVFLPYGKEGRSFAELDSKEKNAISHRGKAMRKLIRFLKEEV